MLRFQIEYRKYFFFEYLPVLNRIAQKYFNIKTKNIWELQNNVDLILANTNPVFHIPKPHVPNYIEIGGLHEREKKPLPQVSSNKKNIITSNSNKNFDCRN